MSKAMMPRCERTASKAVFVFRIPFVSNLETKLSNKQL